jgi:hypothetical protein
MWADEAKKHRLASRRDSRIIEPHADPICLILLASGHEVVLSSTIPG